MAQEVYKNDQGQILFGNSGNIFRKPFNFSNSFVKASNEYIETQISFTNEISILFWLKERALVTTTYIRLLDAADNELLRLDITGDNRHRIVVGGSIKTNDMVSRASYPAFEKFRLRSDGFAIFNVDSNNTSNSTTITLDVTQIAKMQILGTIAVDYVCVVDRYLSNDELNFIYNNKLASEPQSINNYKLLTYLNKAEILNNGGGDFIGVRNEIEGQPHGEFMNLPAGTLQEQLDYANDNLFVTSIN